jgi:hypothetical protein
MNQDLYESLSKQAAHMLLQDRLNPYNYDIYMKHLTELIVRECVDIVEQDMKLAHIQMIPLTLEKYANGRLKQKIQEHFGVEL